MGQGRAQVYNFISLFFLILTLIAVVLVIARMAAPAPVPTQVAIAVPTSAVLPSITPSFTPTFTLTPTLTETLTPTLTETSTPTGTWTIIPSPTPSLTFTPSLTHTIEPSVTISPTLTVEPSLTITNTPNVTATPEPSITNTANPFTPQPTEPPPSPYPFVVRDNQVIYTGNFANTAGCSWQGVGGQVFDLNGQPLGQVTVHVFGNGIDLYTASGSNTLYGMSGWEVPLNTSLTGNSYIVELQSSQGTIISPQVTVTFTANDCGRNLALVNFEQTRPF